MPIDFDIDEKTECITLVLDNQSSMDEVQDKLPALIAKLESLDMPVLFIDYIEESQRPNARRRAGFALFADQLNEHIAKVGISCRTNLRQDLASIVEVMRSRKTPVRFFADSDSARRWLTKGRP
jgi:hypothetical protein